MDIANAPRKANEGLTTFLALLGLFVFVHFFLPSYIEDSVQKGDAAVGELSDAFFEEEDIRFTITDEVFGSEPIEEEFFDIGELSHRGQSGDLDAQIKLAKHFAEIGDEEKAFSWRFRAAMQGDAMSMLDVGERYYYGRGTEPSLVRAVAWYRLSGEHGEAIGFQLAESTGLRISERERRLVANYVRSIKQKMQTEREKAEKAAKAR